MPSAMTKQKKVGLGVAIGVLIALGAGIAFWGFRRGRYPNDQDAGQENISKDPSNKAAGSGEPSNNEDLQDLASDKPEYVKKIKILRGKVAAESRKGELDMHTIILINEALMDITEEDFGKEIVQNRNERRAVIGKDDRQYEELVVKGATQIEKLVSTKILVVLKDCGATSQIYEQSSQSWANKNP